MPSVTQSITNTRIEVLRQDSGYSGRRMVNSHKRNSSSSRLSDATLVDYQLHDISSLEQTEAHQNDTRTTRRHQRHRRDRGCHIQQAYSALTSHNNSVDSISYPSKGRIVQNGIKGRLLRFVKRMRPSPITQEQVDVMLSL
ncbi:hypothetical protein H4219_004430 [Mycoemilia scoparia]|uniref:Uncharacterized protein n=1 Tax=Mycoemilia scoparia TaxID=417184 RepID=A0A9W7ZSD9_9FUNG|nr:hypothetical protein H4219_004430 [Mycoemilia scoparia]